MIERRQAMLKIRRALRRSRVVALIGPRQCGKTTLAAQIVEPRSLNYFDLEDPRSLGRLAEPKTALEKLRGIVVIDEVQHRPDLFPILRVLADRRPLPSRFLVLGSASPNLLRQSSESLAGRLEVIELAGFSNILAPALLRFWSMLAHYHGSVWNAAEPARSLGISEPTVRRYLDLLTGLFMVWQLAPWYENLRCVSPLPI